MILHIGWCERDSYAMVLIQCDQCGSGRNNAVRCFEYPTLNLWAALSNQALYLWKQLGNFYDGEQCLCRKCAGEGHIAYVATKEDIETHMKESWEDQP